MSSFLQNCDNVTNYFLSGEILQLNQSLLKGMLPNTASTASVDRCQMPRVPKGHQRL